MNTNEKKKTISRINANPKRAVEWNKPLLRILEGHKDLLEVTEEFPNLSKFPELAEAASIENLGPAGRIGQRASAAVAIVVVVVCVAVAARPGAFTSEELLRAKLLDVYSASERKTLRTAISVVQKRPDLIKSVLGIDQKALGSDFLHRLNQVDKALA